MSPENQKRIIVVLGMHRSGTSAITRALVALGAQVGGSLITPGTDNPKGFWEDRDFVLFNERLLALLDAGYDSLALLPEAFEQRPEIAELQLEAVLLLRKKLADNDVFALKDPRTCRLLPFWQQVFAHMGATVDYVIAVRHPLSVAQSLSARNTFPQRKSLWLWLQHYISAVQATHGMMRVFVDYDQLLAAPEAQLQRIATALRLAGDDDGQIREYVGNFLSEDLRHTRFTPEDLHLVPDMPEVLLETYQLLLSATASGEGTDFDAAWQPLATELRKQQGMLDFLQEYDRQAQALQQQLLQHERALETQRRGYEETLEAQRLGSEEALEAQRRGSEEALEAQRRGSEEALEAQRLGSEEALEAQRLGCEEALEAQRLGYEETLEAQRLGCEEALEAQRLGYEETLEAQCLGCEALEAKHLDMEKALEAAHCASAAEAVRLNALLTQVRQELQAVSGSRSMRLTTPLRRMAARLRARTVIRHGVAAVRLSLARSRQLLARSRFVLRQEGLFAFCRKVVTYVGRSLRRRLVMNRLERYLPEHAVSVAEVPLVSFIIPIYDRTDVLREAIRSALAQSLPVFEVILVTDGSPAATLAVVEEFRGDPRVRIFNYPTSSGNAVRGRNKGILEARGRYIAFLDSDDIAAPDRLEVCLPLLESGRIDVVYGAWRAKLDGSRQVDGLADGQVVYSPDCDLELLRKVCVPCQSTVMVRRDLLLKAGFLKPRMEYREDHELWARLAYHGARFKSVDHVLTDLRLHSGNNELNFKGDDAHWEQLFGEEYPQAGPRPKKIAFLLGSLGISGGAAVVLRHVSMLLDQGHDAFVINVSGDGDIDWFGNPAIRVYGFGQLDRCGIDNIDLLFATFWTTVEQLDRIPAKRKLYFVQSDERLFYEAPAVQAQVAATYRRDYEYVAIARWICDMLTDEFGRQRVHYVPNGLDLEMFHPDTPLQEKNPKRLRVLLEGPISVPFKGVADAWQAVHDLDCELWIVSSSGHPEAHWRYERFFEAVDHAQMRHIYASCDILLKMSRVESFAYPPLEAMACGCVVVLGDVRGGVEYAVHEVNVLKVGIGNIDEARAAVQRLIEDATLRARLQEAGYATVRDWSWEASRIAMNALIEGDAQAGAEADERRAIRSVVLQ